MKKGDKILVLDDDGRVPYIVDKHTRKGILAHRESNGEKAVLYPFPFYFYPPEAKGPVEYYGKME